MKTKEYLTIKNVIHNELRIKKEDLHNLIKEAIKEEAKNFTIKYLQQNNPDKVIESSIVKECNNLLNGNSYNTNSKQLMEKIGTTLIKKLNISINDNNINI